MAVEAETKLDSEEKENYTHNKLFFCRCGTVINPRRACAGGLR